MTMGARHSILTSSVPAADLVLEEPPLLPEFVSEPEASPLSF